MKQFEVNNEDKICLGMLKSSEEAINKIKNLPHPTGRQKCNDLLILQ